MMEQNPRLGIIVIFVVRLCPFCPWLTFIFGTELADITLYTFHLQEND